MKLIPLSQKSKIDAGKYFAMIDDCDYDLLIKNLWRKDSLGYVSRNIYMGGGRKNQVNKSQKMHRLILGVTDQKIHVDHIDGNPLNNQRSNLRICNNTQNSRNSKKPIGKFSSKYKGVRSYANCKWIAYITVNRTQKHLGIFADETVAAKAYDDAAIKYFGEFANLNFKNNL